MYSVEISDYIGTILAWMAVTGTALGAAIFVWLVVEIKKHMS